MGMYSKISTFLPLYLLLRQIPPKKLATLQWIQRDETTFDTDDMDQLERWQYYTSSFIRVEPTEGVPRDRMQKVLLTRNRSNDGDFEDGAGRPKPLVFEENLTLRIDVHSYKILYKGSSKKTGDHETSSEFHIFTNKPLTYDPETGESATRERLRKYENARTDRFKKKFERSVKWMEGKPEGFVDEKKGNFKNWVDNGVLPPNRMTPNTTSETTHPSPSDLAIATEAEWKRYYA